MRLKPAFNLGELMFFLIIVSIILSIIFTAVKPRQAIQDKKVRYNYAAAYDALNLAFFDMAAEDATNPFKAEATAPGTGFSTLCNGLAGYINTEAENCGSAPVSDTVAYMQNEDFDFNTITPHMTALNGMNFYISNIIKDNVTPDTSKSYYSAENPTYNLEFFMLYVDLDGKEFKNKPHTVKYDSSGKNHPKVFAFAVIPTGDVIPIGIAEYNIKYLQTRVAYRENKYTYFTSYYSLRDAKRAAWNLYSSSGANLKFKEKMSFTYNDYVKEILQRNGSQLYKFSTDGSYTETSSVGLYSKCRPPSGTPLTVYDMCRITVDTPNFGATH